MTMEGTAVGTPHYISPEQARGEVDIDGRADIYSLGATFYLLATGETPYSGNSPAVIMTKHITAPVPDPHAVAPSVPKPVSQIIVKMLQKDPKDRYQSCDQILVDLERISEGKAPLLGGKAPAAEDDEGRAKAKAQIKKVPTGRHTPVASHEKVREKSEPESDAVPRTRSAPPIVKKIREGVEPEVPSTSVEPIEVPAARPTSRSATHAPVQPAAAKPFPMALVGAVAGVIALGVVVGVLLSGGGNSDRKAQPLASTNSTVTKTEPPPGTKTEVVKAPDNPPVTETKITPAPEPNITPVPPPPPQPVVKEEPEIDLPGVPKEPVPPPAPIPSVARAPTSGVDDPALETQAPRVFTGFAIGLKKGQAAEAQASLDDLQNRFSGTKWYAQNRDLLDAAYLHLDMIKQPWGNTFGTPARPLSDPPGDRWDFHYNHFSYVPYERREWHLVGSTTLTWNPGVWAIDHGGGALSGVMFGLPVADLERIEATVLSKPGTTCGWALFSSPRATQPYVSCWTDDDGKIWVTDGKKTTTLKLRMPSGEAATRKIVAYFRKNRAWIEVDKLREEVRIPVSPTGLMQPGFVQSSGGTRVTRVRVQAALESGYLKELADANERARKLRENAKERFEIKVTVSSEFPCAVFAGSVRGQPDGKGTYLPQTYSFTVGRGSIISVLQFNGNATPTGPILINLSLANGKQTGTGLTPHFWSAWGELGNWKGDTNVYPGWLQLPLKEASTEVKRPADVNAKYVMPLNRGVLTRYIFDPDDFK
ncbi:MAG TPA: hypothetical protein VEJ63_14360, partial [Planctomycetota bacterium]|nr:hypothetical protein [Planctomycetota bacterium]